MVTPDSVEQAGEETGKGTTLSAMKLIAVIEDDEALAEVLREMLEEEGTWRVMVIADGAEALTHLPTLKADLILLDVNLPNLDGVSLYRILQGHRATCQTPILFMTASHDWQLQRQGIGPCSAPILWKPFQMDELLERVATMLKR